LRGLWGYQQNDINALGFVFFNGTKCNITNSTLDEEISANNETLSNATNLFEVTNDDLQNSNSSSGDVVNDIIDAVTNSTDPGKSNSSLPDSVNDVSELDDNVTDS